MSIVEIPLQTASFAAVHPLLSAEASRSLATAEHAAPRLMRGRRVWMVSSTARGGGVAEMMRTLLPYWRGAGLDVRWIVVRAAPDVFRVTKRIHNLLHGHPGDRGSLGPAERGLLRRCAASQMADLAHLVSRGDVAVLHDPQTAALTAPLQSRGLVVIWRAHIGGQAPSGLSTRATDFLFPLIGRADAFVLTRSRHCFPPALDGSRTRIITPAIDPWSPKNRPLTRAAVRRVLGSAGLEFRRPLVLALARWDRLKDPIGILDAFAAHVLDQVDADLVLAGPAAGDIADDPDAIEVHAEAESHWRRLPVPERARIHVTSLPLTDPLANATLINALQRRADVVVKKSLEEGFGLGVTEAMWKRRPVVATRVGGQGDQIEDGRSGVLVDDPYDLAGFGTAIAHLLQDPGSAELLGRTGRERVRARYLNDRHFVAWTEVLGAALLSGAAEMAGSRESSGRAAGAIAAPEPVR